MNDICYNCRKCGFAYKKDYNRGVGEIVVYSKNTERFRNSFETLKFEEIKKLPSIETIEFDFEKYMILDGVRFSVNSKTKELLKPFLNKAKKCFDSICEFKFEKIVAEK